MSMYPILGFLIFCYVLGLVTGINLSNNDSEGEKFAKELNSDLQLRVMDLERDLESARQSLAFYAGRRVFQRANKFRGDDDLIEISHVAEEALRGWRQND